MTSKLDRLTELARRELEAMDDPRTRNAFLAAILDGLTNTHGEFIAHFVTRAIINGLPGGRLDTKTPMSARNVHDAITALARVGVTIAEEGAAIAPGWVHEVRGSA
jgi:hypothetical protein